MRSHLQRAKYQEGMAWLVLCSLNDRIERYCNAPGLQHDELVQVGRDLAQVGPTTGQRSRRLEIMGACYRPA